MLDLSNPSSVITPTLDGPVLVVLAQAGSELTVAEVHRRCTRGSEPGVRKVLARLADQGIATVRPAGSALLYSLNRDHLAARAVAAMVGLRSDLWARLRRELAAWGLKPAAACVFGSAARGDGGPHSDIDLLLIRRKGVAQDDERWEAQVSTMCAAVAAWTGNRVQVIDLEEGDLTGPRAAEPLWSAVLSEGIALTDTPLRSLLPGPRLLDGMSLP